MVCHNKQLGEMCLVAKPIDDDKKIQWKGEQHKRIFAKHVPGIYLGIIKRAASGSAHIFIKAIKKDGDNVGE